jgi:hypothetical protein
VLAKRIFLHDGFDLVAVLAERQDDAAVARNLAARDEESSGSVMLLQECHMGAHARVDLGEIRFVNELDDEHRCAPRVKIERAL